MSDCETKLPQHCKLTGKFRIHDHKPFHYATYFYYIYLRNGSISVTRNSGEIWMITKHCQLWRYSGCNHNYLGRWIRPGVPVVREIQGTPYAVNHYSALDMGPSSLHRVSAGDSVLIGATDILKSAQMTAGGIVSISSKFVTATPHRWLRVFGGGGGGH